MSATSTTSGAQPDPADLERQAEALRADMDRTLSALERKFSPEQLIDRSLGSLREHGGELSQTLGATMRNNPVPIVLTLAGLTWLVASSYNSRQPPGQDLSSRFARSGVGQKLQQGAQTARERLSETAASTRDRWSATTQSARDRFASSASMGSGRVSSRLHSARDSARDRAYQVQERVTTLLDEQPLVVGALAVAVGAIIGTAIPSTQYENRVLGAARDRTLSKAQQLGEQQYDSLKSSMQTDRGATSPSGVTETLAGRA